MLMNDVVAAIGEDLRRAVRRRAARRRRRRLALTAALCAAGLATVTAAVAGDVDPLALLPDVGGMSPPAHDVRRVDLTLDGRAGSWHVIAYLSRQGALCGTAALDGAKPDGVGCAAGYVLASDPQQWDTGLAGLGFYDGSRTQRLVTGVVAADVDRLALEDRTGRRYPALLSEATLVVRVRVPWQDLTPLGRRLAEDLPRRVVLRFFAVELPRHAHRGRWSRRQVLAAPRLRIHLHRGDGRTGTAVGPPASG